MEIEHEICTVVVTPRDRFSSTETCLNNIFKNTRAPFEVLVPMGGCPEPLRKDLEKKFEGRARFIFVPGYRNTAELRNLALQSVKTRLAAFLDTDVYVRPGWLEALIKCQQETGAALVTPLVQDKDNNIHTAGNSFHIFKEKGRDYVQMELRYCGLPASPDNNLKRSEIDFAEVHCQLFVAADARDLKVFDENLREIHEMDSGFALAKAGRKMFLEPASRVYLHYEDLVGDPDDARLHLWKWDPKAIQDSMDYFYKKWNLDADYRGQFTHFAAIVYRRVGFLTRRFPSRLAIAGDRVLRKVLG